MFSEGSYFLDYWLIGCPQGRFGISFWMLFGYLGEEFSGLGGSWEQVEISMDFETLPGTSRGSEHWGGQG